MVVKLLCLFCAVITLFTCGHCDICDAEVLPYETGKPAALLDIEAEEISKLASRSMCYKDILIPGAANTTLQVLEAKYSRNQYFRFAGASGQIMEYEADKAFIVFKSCSTANTNKENQWLEVEQGLTTTFQSNELCFKFLPNSGRYAQLGGHEPGGRIRVRFIVNVGHCMYNDTTKFMDTECMPLCSKHGVVRSCYITGTSTDPTTNTATTTTTTTTTASTTTTRPLKISPRLPSSPKGTATTTAPHTTYTGRGTYSPNEWGSTKSTIQASSNTITRHATRPGVKSRTSTYNVTTTGSTRSGTSSTLTTNSMETSAASSPIIFTAMFGNHTGSLVLTPKPTPRLQPTTGNATPPESSPFPYPFTSLENTPAPSRSYPPTVSVRHHRTSSLKPTSSTMAEVDDVLFGFVEGLYVLSGCILLVLIVVGLACCVQKKRSMKLSPVSGPGNTLPHSTSSSDAFWRDNWLIRYHSNAHPDDSLSLPESVQFIHGNFINQSNPELHNIHIDNQRFRRRQGPDGLYDDPWPLVRLDSDFVNRTKNIEQIDSDEVPNGHATAKNEIEGSSLASSEVPEQNIRGRKSTDRQPACSRIVPDDSSLKQDSSEIISTVEKTRYRKKSGNNTTKGTYSVVRLIRRSSTKSERDFIEGYSKPNTAKTNGRPLREKPVVEKLDTTYHELDDFRGPRKELDNRKGTELTIMKSGRSRNNSSMCSDSNITFEEMLEKEIQKLEQTMDSERADIDDVTENLNATQGMTNVIPNKSTVYASVKQNCGSSSKPASNITDISSRMEKPSYRGGASGTMQFPK